MEAILCVGSYTVAKQRCGIQLFELDLSDGQLRHGAAVSNSKSPSFIAFSEDHRYAYAAQELDSEASVTAYRVFPDGMQWKPLNEIVVPGTGMCHVTLSPDGRHLICSNFTTGNVVSCEIRPDGRLGEVKANIQLEGSSVRKDWFQDHSRCHEAVFAPDGRHVIVADMGGDRLMVYAFDADTGILRPNPAQPELVSDPGDGPRHHVFSRDGRMLYSVSEISADVVVYRYEKESCTFERVQKISTVPEDWKAWRTASEIAISRNGRYVFVSNRGCDTIVRFRVLPDGRLGSDSKYFNSLGPETRMFCFDPTERFVIIANQKADRVSVCRYDAEAGEIGEPTCAVSVDRPAFVEAWLRK